MKPVRLSAHASEQALHRGASYAEITAAIRESEWGPAAFGRCEAKKQTRFGDEWNGKRCALKLVRPIFVVEPDEILVVTVYVHHCDEEAP